MKNIIIRQENPKDYFETEHMTMRAFWNLHGPGCNEHLLVHKLRESEDYIPELSRVAELDGRIVGAIFYSKAKVVDGDVTHEVLTFGPLAVEPTCFSMGIGRMLLEETIKLAKEAGYLGIVICGEPEYYPKHGFLTADMFTEEPSTLKREERLQALFGGTGDMQTTTILQPLYMSVKGQKQRM